MKRWIAMALAILCVGLAGCTETQEQPQQDPLVTAYLDAANKHMEAGDLDMAIVVLEEGLTQTGGNSELSALLESVKQQMAAAETVAATETTTETAEATEAATESPETTAATEPATDYTAIAGIWNADDFSWEKGGYSLEILVEEASVTFLLDCVQSAPANRVAHAEMSCLMSELEDGKAELEYEDSWGNAGEIIFDFTNPVVAICTIVETYREPLAMWGLGNDTVVLQKARQPGADDLVGHWRDSVTNTAYLIVEKTLTGYQLRVMWAQSADVSYTWEMTGVEGEGGSIFAGECKKYVSAGGTQTLLWDNGTANFYLNGDGTLFWEDNKEGSGDSCIFIKVL